MNKEQIPSISYSILYKKLYKSYFVNRFNKIPYITGKIAEQKLEKALDAFMVSANSGEYYGRLYSDLSMYYAGELAFKARKMDEAEFYLKQLTETRGKLSGKAYNLLVVCVGNVCGV